MNYGTLKFHQIIDGKQSYLMDLNHLLIVYMLEKLAFMLINRSLSL